MVSCFFHTRKFDDEFFEKKYIDEYNEDNFWEELVSRLALRDMIRDYGLEKIRKMDNRSFLEKRFKYEEKYHEEFEDSGLEDLIIHTTTTIFCPMCRLLI